MALSRPASTMSVTPIGPETMSKLSPQAREVFLLINSDPVLRAKVKDILWAELAPELMQFARAEAEKAVAQSISSKQRKGVGLGKRSVWDAIKERFPQGQKVSRALDDPVGEIFGWPEHLSLELLDTPTAMYLLEFKMVVTKAHIESSIRVMDFLATRMESKKRLSLFVVCNTVAEDARTALKTACQSKINMRDTVLLEDPLFDIAGAKGGAPA